MADQARRSFAGRWTWLVAVAALVMAALASAADHLPLARDGVHDPANPGLKLLQEPQEALSTLPPDAVGNQVRWVKALQDGNITPRTNILQNTRVYTLNLDVLLPYTGEMPMVLFPHKQHTEWLDCTNCHEHLFKYKANGTKGLNMFNVLQGEFCGRCHGAVAFPLTECRRCHSVERK